MGSAGAVEVELEGGARARRVTGAKRRALLGACLAHVLHDGCTDGIYILLPVWQREFGLGYAALAMLRCLYYGTMGGLQIPANARTRGFGAKPVLVVATVIAGAGFLLLSVPGGGLVGVGAGLFVGGLGSSLQHPRGSTLVTDTEAAGARRALGLYNFAGDGGKAVFPPMIALLLLVLPWQGATAVVGVACVLGAAALLLVLPRAAARPAPATADRAVPAGRRGFGLLLWLGVLDTATRMNFLLFLPFLVTGKHGSETIVGAAFAAVYVGGAFGKAVCGRLPERFGVAASVIATELATVGLIVAVVVLPLDLALAALPLLGVVLNGTSSVFYGTVPELAPTADLGRAFAQFYTGVIVSGAVAPILFGAVGDAAGRTVGVLAATGTALATIPVVLLMERHLRRNDPRQG